MSTIKPFAQLLHAFFYDWLIAQRNSSRHTVMAYRDSWRLFLRFVAHRQHKAVAKLALEHVGASAVLAFLDDLEPYHWGYWAVMSDGVYYVDPKARQVLFVRFATGETSTIASLQGQPTPFGANFAISPDRRWLLYVRQKPVDGDIMLVEDFL